MPRQHQCPVQGCQELVNRAQLMCPRHWYRAPIRLRKAVWRAWRTAPGSAEHLDACAAAIAAVERLGPVR